MEIETDGTARTHQTSWNRCLPTSRWTYRLTAPFKSGLPSRMRRNQARHPDSRRLCPGILQTAHVLEASLRWFTLTVKRTSYISDSAP